MTGSLHSAGGWLLRTTLPATRESATLARTLVQELVASLEFGEKRAADVALSVTEAVSNAILHAYPNPNGAVDLTARTDAANLHVSVRDYGHGLSTSRDPGMGLGLPLMWELCDDFRIEAGNPGLAVHLTFRLPS